LVDPQLVAAVRKALEESLIVMSWARIKEVAIAMGDQETVVLAAQANWTIDKPRYVQVEGLLIVTSQRLWMIDIRDGEHNSVHTLDNVVSAAPYGFGGTNL